MFSALVTGYLFLGGAGGGALVVLSVLECANMRLRRRMRLRLDAPGSVLPNELFTRAWPICFIALAFGIFCLFADIGRPDRVFGLVTSPQLSAMTVGAWALFVAFVVAAIFAAQSLLDGISFGLVSMVILAAVGAMSGFVVMSYTGLLLASMASVLVWQTPLLPVVFIFSSLSCGIAVVFLAAAFDESRQPVSFVMIKLTRADRCLIVLEAICLTAFLLWAQSGQGTQEAARALTTSNLAWVFWGGVVALGIGAPLALELFVPNENYRMQFLLIAACVFAGGCALRACIVGAGAYDVTQMPEMFYGLIVQKI